MTTHVIQIEGHFERALAVARLLSEAFTDSEFQVRKAKDGVFAHDILVVRRDFPGRRPDRARCQQLLYFALGVEATLKAI